MLNDTYTYTLTNEYIKLGTIINERKQQKKKITQ